MKLGLKIGIGFLGEFQSVEEKIEYTKKAEEYGLHSAWICEHYYHRDSIVTATALLANTKRLVVGTAIVNPFTRHPAMLAMAAATLSEFSHGRFILGLGLGIPAWNEEQLGIPMGSPQESLSEAANIVKSLLAGETVNVMGKRFRASGARLGFSSNSRFSTPVYLAGVRPLLLRLAGELGDGVILPICSTVSYIRNSLPFIKEGVKKSGKESKEVVCLAYLSLSETSEQAKKTIKPHLFTLLMRPGREELIFPDAQDQQKKIKNAKLAMQRGDKDEAIDLISDDIVEEVCVSGTVSECLNSLQRYKDAGVTELALIPLGSEQTLVESFMERAKRIF